MPNFAICNEKVIRVEDIYKFNINKNSDFKCFTCDKKLNFRQSRNGDKNYTEHFFHPNTKKGTHYVITLMVQYKGNKIDFQIINNSYDGDGNIEDDTW